jgi:hypothetical protein
MRGRGNSFLNCWMGFGILKDGLPLHIFSSQAGGMVDEKEKDSDDSII